MGNPIEITQEFLYYKYLQHCVEDKKNLLKFARYDVNNDCWIENSPGIEIIMREQILNNELKNLKSLQ